MGDAMKMTEYRCPVCDMGRQHSTLCVEHFGITYHFCSAQCRQNFLAHPRLYVGMKSVKQSGRAIVKQRKFRVGNVLQAEQKQQLQSKLTELMGIQSVDIHDGTIFVAYDLLEVSAQQIQSSLEKIGVALGSTWSTRLQLAWIEYIEENELDNLSLNPPACCNKAP